MALYTPLALDQARTIGARYGLEVLDVTPLVAGSVNSNFALTVRQHGGANGKVFLRVYEEQDADGAESEAALLRWLVDRGVPAAPPLRSIPRSILRSMPPASDGTNGTTHVAMFGDRPVALFPWVPGDMRCQASVRPEDTFAVGEALARIHLAGMPAPRPGRFTVARLIERCDVIESATDESLRAMASVLRGWLRDIESRREPGCSQGLCHGDVFRDNVLWEGERLTAILDFESAATGTFMFDLATTFHAWCFADDFVPGLSRSLVRGYCSVRPLPDLDRRGLFEEARLSALRFTTTRITDYAMRASSGANEARDWRRFLRRFERVNEIGADGLLGMMGI